MGKVHSHLTLQWYKANKTNTPQHEWGIETKIIQESNTKEDTRRKQKGGEGRKKDRTGRLDVIIHKVIRDGDLLAHFEGGESSVGASCTSESISQSTLQQR